MKPRCTHVALFCRDLSASVAFYAEHVGLHEMHRRTEDGTTVVWMAEEGRDDDFVLVMLGVAPQGGAGAVAHLGYAVGSREEVDHAARRAREAGFDVQRPVYAGPVVGYYCMVRDPDGNWVEFSFGQALGPTSHG
jgi:catechol 2,3-dioxygenase-like lactoylglutathione lyase family enzyme